MSNKNTIINNVKSCMACQSNVFKLLPEIKLFREVTLHDSSWIHNLSDELALNKKIELHIITHSHLVDKSQQIMKME